MILILTPEIQGELREDGFDARFLIIESNQIILNNWKRMGGYKACSQGEPTHANGGGGL